jgi:ketohexokinase
MGGTSRDQQKVLVIGNIVLDIVNVCEHYPEENAEVRALQQYRKWGGNAANTSFILAALGMSAAFMGTLPEGPEGKCVKGRLLLP